MKLYLSSYQLGDNPQTLYELFGENKKIGLISNALDFSSDSDQINKIEQEQLHNLRSIGLYPEVVDLRKYFGNKDELSKRISHLGGVWVRGGNTFVLASAYSRTGFDKIIREELVVNADFVYSGFSAGCCVLQRSLKGLDFVDDPEQVRVAYGDKTEIVWEGVGVLDYVFVPHFESDHLESEDTMDEIEYYKKNNIPFKCLRDGEVIIDQIDSIL